MRLVSLIVAVLLLAWVVMDIKADLKSMDACEKAGGTVVRNLGGNVCEQRDVKSERTATHN